MTERTDQDAQLTPGEVEQGLGGLSQSQNLPEVPLDAAVLHLTHREEKHNSGDVAHLKTRRELNISDKQVFLGNMSCAVILLAFTPTMMPSILKPSVDVELVVSLH